MKKPLLAPAVAAALLMSSLVTGEQVVVCEVMYHPVGTKPEFIEILNLTSNRLDTAKWRLTGGVELTFPDFAPASPNAHFLKENERLVLSSADPATTRAAYPSISPGLKVFGPWTGQLDNAGDQIILEDFSGTRVCELNYGDGGKWPVAADGAGHSLVLINENRAVDDWRNWRASPSSGGTPGNPEIRAAEEAIPAADLPIVSTYSVTSFNNTPAIGGVPAPANPGDTKWKFYNDQVAPAAEWTQPGFDDSGWGPSDPALGYAPLGFEPVTTSAVFPGIRTPIAPNQPLSAYYFRTTFDWSGPLTGNTFAIDEVLDDGAVVWLNGQVIGRERLTTNPALHTSSATTASTDGAYELNRMAGIASVLEGKLVAGINTLAVEVHNILNTDADMTMAMRLKISNSQAGVVINEVKPSTTVGSGFVEIYNPLAQAVDLNGYYLSDDGANLTKFKITTPLAIAPGALTTVDFAGSGLTPGNPVTVYLTRPDGVSKESAVAINMPTDGRSAGRKPTGGIQWFVFVTPTPGASNQAAPLPPGSTLTLSEAHFGATGRVDWVEFANSAAGAASGVDLFVSSRADFLDRVALPGSVPGSGFASVATDFVADGSGDIVLYLADAQNNVLETVELTERPSLPSVQKFPATSKEWYNAATPTKDVANSPARHDEIVINEIMFAPPSSQSQGEYVELYNRGASPVSLAGWRFVDGLSFDFPASASLAPGQFAVVAKDPAYIAASYPSIAAVYGPAAGVLRNSGEIIRLEDERRNLADSVDYHVGGQWPSGTSGEGSSLELIHPDMDNSQPSAWRASDESQKTTLQSYTHTDTYRQQRGAPSAATDYKELLVTAVADAHLLLKDISLTRPGSANLITTGDATSHNGSSATGFLCTGTHSQSDTLPRVGATLVGDDGFHLISTGAGDTKNNKADVDCTAIAQGNVLTLTFQARWLSGMPLLVMQTWDRSFGKVFRLPVPNNLGTPGAANSTAIPAPAPTVDDMIHSPAVPRPTESVVVKARVASPVDLTSVELVSRTDNAAANGAWSSILMNDSGTGGDVLAGDGIWSATTAPKADATLTQFYIRATSINGRISECPRNGAAMPGMWIVDNTPPTSKPGTIAHRFVVSKYHRDALGTNGFTAKFDWDFPRMSNHEFNTTVILGETTFAGGPDIFYNCGMRKGGSPWTRGADNTGGLSRMRWKSPGDNLFRNRSKTGVDNDAGPPNPERRFHNRISRYMLYLFGYSVPDHEFIQQIINEDAPRLSDDMEPTDSDFFDRAYPDGSQGELFEIDDAWFMFDGAAESRISADGVTGRWALTDWSNQPAYPSAESPIFFHGNWPVRFPEDRYDYGALSSFIKSTVTGTTGATGSIATDAWREQVERQIDTERAAIYAAVRGYTGDWDNFTMERGKNGYFYRRPADGKFEFHHWDSDLTFDVGRSFLGTAGGPGWINYSGRPWFRRAFDFYLTELLTKYTKGSVRMQAWLDAMNYQSANTDTLAPFKTSVYNYPGFFTARETPAITFVNAVGQTATSKNYSRPFAITTADNQSVSTPRFTIAGDSPTRVRTIEVSGHPEAVFTWLPDATSYGKWSLSNLALAAGINSLTVRALSLDGSVFASLPFTVTLSVNAPPIAVLTVDPPSMNVSAHELVVLDGTTSTDPEGGPLTFSWTVTSLTGVSLAHSVPGKTEALFSIPGVYTATLNVTDGSGLSASATHELTVFASDDFRAFGGGVPLDAGLTVQNAKPRDNYSPASWYSVEDLSGRLQIQVMDDSAKPLGNPTFNHPLVTRDLPDSSDFVLQTDLDLATREFGSFITGLWLEFSDGAQPVRYAFGIAGGTNVALFSAVGAGAWEMMGTSQPYTAAANATGLSRLTLADSTDYTIGQSVLISGSDVPAYDGLRRITAKVAGSLTVDAPFTTTAAGTVIDPGSPFTGTEGILRVRRTGAQLAFEIQVGGVWTQVRTATLGAGATAGRGGIFVATTSATTARVSFDYLLVADPTRFNALGTSLRLTEVMYNPLGAGVEYLEFQNIGAQPINLTGGNLAEGQPVSAYAFGAEMVTPGEFVILTENVAAFKTKYGNGPRVLGAWSAGSLNNGGERIVLRDPQANSIHDFGYDNSSPWPTEPDGLGPSLEVIDVNGDYNDPANWRASFESSGSPGFAGLGRDSDGDGQSDGAESFFGTDPQSPSSQPTLSAALGLDGSVSLSTPSVSGRSYRLERTADLVTWAPLQTVIATGITTGFTDSTSAPAREYFYRIVALP